MGKLQDLKGRRFGRLLVCRRDMSRIGHRSGAYWICKCDCGRGCTVTSSNLLAGLIKSCGCLR